MTTPLDLRITAIEAELQKLRQRKLYLLCAEVEALTLSLRVTSRGPRADVGGNEKRRRGKRVKWRRFTDEAALAALTEAVRAAGGEGVAGKKASFESGVSYPRAIKLMDANFKKSGSGKWTRYTLR